MKIKLGVIVLGGMLMATAGHAMSHNEPHLFGTLGLGASTQNHHVSWINGDISGTGAPAATNGLSLSGSSVAGRLDLGYAMNLQKKWHVGGFFNLQVDSFNQPLHTDPAAPGEVPVEALRIKQTSLPWGGGLRFGYKCDKVLGYLSLGAMTRSYKVTFDVSDNAGAAVHSINKTQKFTSFVPGIGLEYYINPKLTFGILGTASFAKSKNITSTTPAGTSLKIMPRVYSTLLTASYKFHL